MDKRLERFLAAVTISPLPGFVPHLSERFMHDVEQLPREGVICGDIGAKYNITLA